MCLAFKRVLLLVHMLQPGNAHMRNMSIGEQNWISVFCRSNQNSV